MYIQSGELKVNKEDIEAIKIFIAHARADIAYAGNGSYWNGKLTYNEYNEPINEVNKKEYRLGKLGLENIEYMLKTLCPKYNK